MKRITTPRLQSLRPEVEDLKAIDFHRHVIQRQNLREASLNLPPTQAESQTKDSLFK
jgi:hypothetical protein